MQSAVLGGGSHEYIFIRGYAKLKKKYGKTSLICVKFFLFLNIFVFIYDFGLNASGKIMGIKVLLNKNIWRGNQDFDLEGD